MLDELERRQMTLPLSAQRAASGWYEVNNGSGLYVCGGVSKEDAHHLVVAVNALPTLLRVARAARAVVAADRAWDAYIRDDGPDDDARAEALDDMANEAKAELRAALAALEAAE